MFAKSNPNHKSAQTQKRSAQRNFEKQQGNNVRPSFVEHSCSSSRWFDPGTNSLTQILSVQPQILSSSSGISTSRTIQTTQTTDAVKISADGTRTINQAGTEPWSFRRSTFYLERAFHSPSESAKLNLSSRHCADHWKSFRSLCPKLELRPLHSPYSGAVRSHRCH